jgi:hypothetical protein
MLQELLYLGPEQRLRRLSSSVCVQNLNREAPATFGMQILDSNVEEIKQPIRKQL